MSAEERSKWMARLDAVISAAYIVGQAIGGLLATKSCQLPLYLFEYDWTVDLLLLDVQVLL